MNSHQPNPLKNISKSRISWPALLGLAILGIGPWIGSPAHASENDHGLVYVVQLTEPGDGDPVPPPLTSGDQVRYCAIAEEWSRRIWEVTDGSHLIYQVHFYSGYEEPLPQAGVQWRRWQGLPNAGLGSHRFRMFDYDQGCAKVYRVENGELLAGLECLEPGQVCSSHDPDDLRSATCSEAGVVVKPTNEELGWVMAHENSHSHYDLNDEYIGAPNRATHGFHVCVGTEDNRGTEHTSMMAKRDRNHWCDGSTHVTERPVRGRNGEVLLDDQGDPFLESISAHPAGAWKVALESGWQKQPLEYSGDYSSVAPFPGLPIPHLSTGNPVPFCVWHFEGDGRPTNDLLLLLDKSGSMGFEHPAFENGSNALDAAVQSAVSLYNSARSDRLVGVTAFDTALHSLEPYELKGPDLDGLEVEPGGGTDLCAAIAGGADAIKAAGPSADFGKGQQILLSDGRPTVSSCASDGAVLQAAVDACDGGAEGFGVKTHTLAFGDADRELLRRIADACGGQTTALQVPTTSLRIDGAIEPRSTPLQIGSALTRAGIRARESLEIQYNDQTLAPQRDDALWVPPGTAELVVEWQGDGFKHLEVVVGRSPETDEDSNAGGGGESEAKGPIVADCRFGTLQFQLVRPDGSILYVPAETDPGDPEPLVRVARVTAPEAGPWQARIVADHPFVCYPGYGGEHSWGDYDPRVAVVASIVNTGLSPFLKVTPTLAPRDTPITLVAGVDQSPGARWTDLQVRASLYHQQGAAYHLALWDNGEHGDEQAGDGLYTAVFNAQAIALESGGYRVAVTLTSSEQGSRPVWVADDALDAASGPLPAVPSARFVLEDTFVYERCRRDESVGGSTCLPLVATPVHPSAEDPCAISVPPGQSLTDVKVATQGLPLGERGVQVTAGTGVAVRNIRTLSYDGDTRSGLVSFDITASPAADPGPRFLRVAFADRAVSSQGCYTAPAPFNDCNRNGVDDLLDIENHSSQDINLNDIPDECEIGSVSWFFSGVAQGGTITTTIEGFFATCTVGITTTPGQTGIQVAEAFAAALQADPCLAGQNITASVDGNGVILTGFELSHDRVFDVINDPGIEHTMPVVSIPTLSLPALGLMVLILMLAGARRVARR